MAGIIRPNNRDIFNNDVDDKKIEENEDDAICAETNAGDSRSMRKMHDPKLPSKAEVEAHNLNHLPYRSWCRTACVGVEWKSVIVKEKFEMDQECQRCTWTLLSLEVMGRRV